MDTLPYKQFKMLRQKYPTRMVRLTQLELALAPGAMAAQFMRDFVAKKFKEQHGVEVVRWIHDYESLLGTDPKLGLVYLASDSELDPALEVWGLLGHSIREIRA